MHEKIINQLVTISLQQKLIAQIRTLSDVINSVNILIIIVEYI